MKVTITSCEWNECRRNENESQQHVVEQQKCVPLLTAMSWLGPWSVTQRKH